MRKNTECNLRNEETIWAAARFPLASIVSTINLAPKAFKKPNPALTYRLYQLIDQ